MASTNESSLQIKVDQLRCHTVRKGEPLAIGSRDNARSRFRHRCRSSSRDSASRIQSSLQPAIVLAHDYAQNRQVFKANIRGERWSWREITVADLPATGIKSIESQMLRDAMWFCGAVKIKLIANRRQYRCDH